MGSGMHSFIALKLWNFRSFRRQQHRHSSTLDCDVNEARLRVSSMKFVCKFLRNPLTIHFCGALILVAIKTKLKQFLVVTDEYQRKPSITRINMPSTHWFIVYSILGFQALLISSDKRIHVFQMPMFSKFNQWNLIFLLRFEIFFLSIFRYFLLITTIIHRKPFST